MANGVSPSARQPIVDGANFAQEKCYRLIHHDTFAYEGCIRSLLAGTKKVDGTRLGIEYFGWVGALNSARMGMLGADAAALEFLKRFRMTQKKLQIDDLSLCQSIPGDCKARIARMKQMEAAPPAGASPAHAKVVSDAIWLDSLKKTLTATGH